MARHVARVPVSITLFAAFADLGVCVLLREPVPGLIPLRPLRHPGITLTLAEPEPVVASLRRRAGLA